MDSLSVRAVAIISSRGPESTTTYTYQLIVYWSAEDAAYIIDVPELPGCMAHGATPTDAVAIASSVERHPPVGAR